MPLTSEEITEWASAYIDAVGVPTDVAFASPIWWSIDRFMNLENPNEAEDAWVAILEILHRSPSDEVIGILAAGPLEYLIERWGPVYIERIEREAREDPAFRHLLGGVWRSSTPEVWDRIEAARGSSW